MSEPCLSGSFLHYFSRPIIIGDSIISMSTEEVCIHQPWGLIHHSAFPEQKKYRELSLVSLKAVIFHLEIGSDFSISNPFLKSPSQE